MTTLTASRVADMPRVNLLPPEIEAAARLARTKRLLVALIVAIMALLAVGFVWATRQVSSAQATLDDANAEQVALQAQAAQYAKVPQVNAQLAVAQVDLATAMAPEVRVSFLMNDLSLTIPSSVRLTSMVVGVGASDPVVQAAVATAATNGLPAPSLAGSVSYQGKANGYGAVASWLASFNKQAAYSDSYLGSTTQDESGTTVGTTYSFTSTAALTDEAKSNRFTKAGQ